MENYSDAMEFINSFTKHGAPIKDLSRFSHLMSLLNDPQDKLKFVHVAGTNGKGSTVQFCASALISAGYTVGEFTSPFIIEYTDRIRINNQNIPHQHVAKYAEIVEKAVLDNKDFSQFEISTAIAFLYFLDKKCDIVVLETGIGGLVDSTNVVKNTLVSVITAISFDHTKILGDTIEKIAVQKAGIIKPDSNVVLSADNTDEVISIVKTKAESEHSSFFMPDINALLIKKCDIFGSEFTYKNEDYNIKMAGKHQIINAISAIETLNILKNNDFNISKSNIKTGLAKAQVCVRAEIIKKNPLTIIDGAHNPAAAKALSYLLENMITQKPIVMVVGMLAEKNTEKFVAEFSRTADFTVCIDNFYPNTLDNKKLAELFITNGINATCESNIKGALIKAEELAGKNGAVIICGSLFLAGEARKQI